jgi:Ca-activated chloride channel homolog
MAPASLKLIFMVLLPLLIVQEPIRVDVSLVTVGVRVLDSRGRDVRGLKVEDFAVIDDGVPQNIAFFSGETKPITLGILVDHSSSMEYGKKIDRAKDAALALVKGAREGSEFFYIAFDNHVEIASNFTTDRNQVEAAIQKTVPDGGTSLYDAILEGVMLTGSAHLSRQALIIISDGGDQHSTHKLQEILSAVRESEIQIYTIGYFSKEEETQYEDSGSKVTLINGEKVDNPRLALESIARESGGESYFPRSDEQLAKAVRDINEDLRTQYTIAFYPHSTDRDNRYHQLRVTVPGTRYRVRARAGYGTS